MTLISETESGKKASIDLDLSGSLFVFKDEDSGTECTLLYDEEEWNVQFTGECDLDWAEPSFQIVDDEPVGIYGPGGELYYIQYDDYSEQTLQSESGTTVVLMQFEDTIVWTQGEETCELYLTGDGLTIVGECNLAWDEASFVRNEQDEITAIIGPGGEVFPYTIQDESDEDTAADEETQIEDQAIVAPEEIKDPKRVTELQKKIAAGLAGFQFMFLLKD